MRVPPVEEGHQIAHWSRRRGAGLSVARPAIDAQIFQALPRITPVDIAAIWGEYVTWAKEDLRRHERETELFLAWV